MVNGTHHCLGLDSHRSSLSSSWRSYDGSYSMAFPILNPQAHGAPAADAEYRAPFLIYIAFIFFLSYTYNMPRDQQSEFWNYLSQNQKDLILEGDYLLNDVVKHSSYHFKDYSFVVFPYAKAYEGY